MNLPADALALPRAGLFRPGWSGRLRVWLGAWLVLVLGLALGLAMAPAKAQEVQVGVLSFRSLDQTRAQWAPTIDHLNARMPGYRFQLIPLYYPDLDKAVKDGRLEFVFTNPEHYVLLRSAHGLAALVTLMPLAEGHPVNNFGGVVLTRADRTDINTLADLKGRRVASPSRESLGGYLIQRWALQKAGVEERDLKEIRLLGMPHDKSVLEVLAGKADAGFVRTGVLEAMSQEGKVAMHEIKVLNQQPAGVFPQLLSTDLYPEWPFCARNNVPETLTKAVTLALLSIPPDSAAAQVGKYYGFSPPVDYSPIEAIMLRLKLHPSRLEHFDLSDILNKYALGLLTGLGLLLLLALAMVLRLYVAKGRIAQAHAEIHSLAFYDTLTQLPNRRLLLDRLHKALDATGRQHKYGALLFVDLDDFKTLNDTLGHDRGDLLLEEMARRLTACVRREDTVARLGGDEFVVMLEGLHAQETQAATQAEGVANKILASTRRPYQLDQHERIITASIGVALFGNQQQSIDELLKQADMAMYQAKSSGRDAVFFFDPDMQAALETRAELERELRQAIEKGEFALFYQLQVDRAGRALGVEALIRWHHPRRGWLLPKDFLPLAEETGLIQPIGTWALQAACAQMSTWHNHPSLAGLAISVNISTRQFHHPGFVPELRSLLMSTCVRGNRLKLELTESLFQDNPEERVQKMNALRDVGVRFSLDGFGNGFCSLNHLRRLPLEEIKIDPSFIAPILHDPGEAAITQTLIGLGKTLGLEVVAEGVESEAQMKMLLEQGCSRFQGFLFGEPVSAADLERVVANRLGQGPTYGPPGAG